MGSHKNKPVETDLRAKICERLKWDKRVSPADFDVIVRGCSVIVTGSCDTSYKKMAALELVSDFEGVWSIEDRIVVPSDYYRSDEELKKLILEAMEEFVMIGGEHIEVFVEDGVVTLEGEVFRPRLKALAVGSAWELSGVQDVINNIVITDRPRRAPFFQNLYRDTDGSGSSAKEAG
ncbi:BON domain-containing protein [Bdellovibrio sp. ZAP7]|uniref:BON domain-containing protein n=1 Tax=Bdellovibrio sp. ZAP7 TaxID=2231053 RepID=UPI001156F293|nr:BON domain-containing protein [Bdellovibrio sp. ZAP7]QDK46999.1 BON domain-containing protein [Bdellovibrio sp. ZAP7]